MTTKEWLERHDRQIAAHDRQIKAIRELVHEGMRLVIESRKEMRVIRALHKQNEEKLDRLIRALERGTNGHPKDKLDIQ
jgi:hypothetical protein